MKRRKRICSYIKKLEASPFVRRFVTGTIWTFSGTAFAKVLALVSGVLCAHLLGKSEYGELGIIRSTVGMFTILGTAGLGITATKYISQYKKSDTKKVASVYLLTSRFTIVTGIVVTILVLLMAPLLAEKTLHAPGLTDSIRIASLMLFVSVVNGSQSGTLYGFEDYKSIAINNLIGGGGEALLMLIGAKYYGVFGALLGFGSGYVILYILNKISIKRCFRKYDVRLEKKFIRKGDYRILFNFALPALLASLLATPTLWLIKTLLVRSDGFEELADFEAANYWRTIILYIPYAVGTIILPILSDKETQSNQVRFLKIIKYNVIINGVIAFFVSAIVVIFSPWLTGLFGKEYTDSATLAILAISTVFTSTSNVIGLSLTSRSLMWHGLLLNLIWSTILISLSILFVNNGYGASGLAWATLLAYLIHTINSYFLLRYSLKKNENTICNANSIGS